VIQHGGEVTELGAGQLVGSDRALQQILNIVQAEHALGIPADRAAELEGPARAGALRRATERAADAIETGQMIADRRAIRFREQRHQRFGVPRPTVQQPCSTFPGFEGTARAPEDPAEGQRRFAGAQSFALGRGLRQVRAGLLQAAQEHEGDGNRRQSEDQE